MLRIEKVPEVGELLNGLPVTKRQRSTDGRWRVLLGGTWQPIEVPPPTLTTAHIELLLSSSNTPAKQAAISLWARTPQDRRELVVSQCDAKAVTQLKKTVFYA